MLKIFYPFRRLVDSRNISNNGILESWEKQFFRIKNFIRLKIFALKNDFQTMKISTVISSKQMLLVTNTKRHFLSTLVGSTCQSLIQIKWKILAAGFNIIKCSMLSLLWLQLKIHSKAFTHTLKSIPCQKSHYHQLHSPLPSSYSTKACRTWHPFRQCLTKHDNYSETTSSAVLSIYIIDMLTFLMKTAMNLLE